VFITACTALAHAPRARTFAERGMQAWCRFRNRHGTFSQSDHRASKRRHDLARPSL